MGRPYLYDGANTVMSLILSGATIKFERYLLKEGADNPNIPGSKLPRDMYFTNIKSITLDMASIKELAAFIKGEIDSLKKKEVEQVELTAIPED